MFWLYPTLLKFARHSLCITCITFFFLKKISGPLAFFVEQFVDVGTMVSPTVYARRSLCYLLCDQPDAALRDAMQAQCVYPDWPTAFYMQSVALAKLDMHKDAADMLNEAAGLEEKRQKGGRGS